LWLTALALCPGAALAACAGRSAGAGASSRAGSAAPQSRGEAETPAEAQRERRRVQRAVRDFADALEGRSLRAVIEMLDEDSFDDRARFEDQVNALLRQSREMRVLFRESSLEVKGGRASMTVDAEMIFALRGRTRQDVRRKERLQFDFVRTARGWKVSALTPRQFFMP
jgi:hypothetical protein